MLAGVVIGSYADDYVGTSPWLTLVLTMGAMGGATYRLLWMLKRLGADDTDREGGDGGS